MPQAISVPYAIRDWGCLNKNGAVTDGHTSPCKRDSMPSVFVSVCLYIRRGEQEYFFLYGGQHHYIQCGDFRHLYGVADTAITHFQAGEGAPVTVVATIRTMAWNMMMNPVARMSKHMLHTRLAALVTTITDKIHTRTRPDKAHCQHDCDTICQPLFHFICKITAFCRYTQYLIIMKFNMLAFKKEKL